MNQTATQPVQPVEWEPAREPDNQRRRCKPDRRANQPEGQNTPEVGRPAKRNAVDDQLAGEEQCKQRPADDDQSNFTPVMREPWHSEQRIIDSSRRGKLSAGDPKAPQLRLNV